MNVFALDRDPAVAARYHCDQHMKMLLESGQMLSTAHRVLDGVKYYERSKNGRRIARWRLDDDREHILYKATHVNHPCSIWVRESIHNYFWLYELMEALNEENLLRRGKDHGTWLDLSETLLDPPENIPDVPATPFAVAIDSKVVHSDPVEAYRDFYRRDKASFATWKLGREEPHWYNLETA